MLSRFLAASAATLAVLPSSRAITIHACDIGGALSTFSLTPSADGGADIASLDARNEDFISIRAMTFDQSRGLIYALDVNDEVMNGTMYVVNATSGLTKMGNATTPVDPTWAIVFGDNNDGLAVPAYMGSAFATYDVTDPNAPTAVEVASYGGTSHPHEAIIDPSGNYLIVPDLGSDVIRTLRLDGLAFEQVATYAMPAGSGPRHGVFTTLAASNTTMFYLVSETASTITGFSVAYAAAGAPPTFTQVYNSSTHGLGNTVSSDETTGGDIHVQDGFLLVSSRYDVTSENATNPTGAGPLISFAIDQSTGNLTLVQQWSLGGSIGAEFALNAEGTLVAMGYLDQFLMKLVHRDVETGLLGDVAGTFNLTGRLMGMMFDD